MSFRQVRMALASCRDLPEWEVDDRPFHQALRARGVEVECLIWDDPEVDWASYDLVLIRTTWDYQERCEEFVLWAQRVAVQTLLLNPPTVVRWNTDKHYLRELETRGARLVPTAWLERGSCPDIAQEMIRLGGSRGFLKPTVGATARETMRFDLDDQGIAQAQEHCARLLPVESLILQPYQVAVETDGEISVILFDGEPSHAVRKVPVPGDYRVQDDFGASDRPEPLSDELVSEARRILSLAEESLELEEGALLYARVDFLRDSQWRLCLNELELVEPSLFFRHSPESPDRLARAILRRLA